MVIKELMVPIFQGNEIKDILIDDKGIIIKISNKLDSSYGNEIDGSGCFIIPGFIDVHTHGFNGYESDDNCNGLLELSKRYAVRGTLGFCPTIGPKPLPEYLRIVKEYKKAFDAKYEGSRFLGLHLEGPYLNSKKAGALLPESMYPINLQELEEFLIQTKGYVKIMTIAPELDGAIDAIKLLNQYSITASIGHTFANYEEAINGLNAGITHATHTYNAMRDFDHRISGILEALWLNDKVYCELIADGVHVSKTAINVLLRLKGMERVIAVSDGDKRCGLNFKDGYSFEDGCYIKNNAVYTKNHTLSGSTQDVYDHFKFFMNEMDCPIYDAVNLTSTNAAKHLGLDFGELKVGNKANLLIIDKRLNIKNIIIEGKLYK